MRRATEPLKPEAMQTMMHAAKGNTFGFLISTAVDGVETTCLTRFTQCFEAGSI